MIYRDPRQMARDKALGTVVYVFSHPDDEEVKEWAKKRGLPARAWDEKFKRLRVYGRFVTLALTLDKAPADVMAEKFRQWAMGGRK